MLRDNGGLTVEELKSAEVPTSACPPDHTADGEPVCRLCGREASGEMGPIEASVEMCATATTI
jgi:hypothetical protein